MAEVFRARLPGVAGFEKIVVIKRILPHLARKKRFVQMFVREANLAAQVHHRNVVQVYELGQLDEGEYYMAMEYVKGTDLRRILSRSTKRGLRIPPWFSIYVVAEILDALEYAHTLRDNTGQARCIIHRDVTPSNIFISHLGEVKLGDFGVARDETVESNTRTGQLKGKIAYMSPEQLYSKDLDRRTDVFATAVVLWESLAQRRLFGGRPDFEAMNLITKGERKPPSSYLRDIPTELDDIVLQGLQPNREKRIESAKQFRTMLLDILPVLRANIRSDDVRSVVEMLTSKDPRASESLPPPKRSPPRQPSVRPRAPSRSPIPEAPAFTSNASNPALTPPPRPESPTYVESTPPASKSIGAILSEDLSLDPPQRPNNASSNNVHRAVAPKNVPQAPSNSSGTPWSDLPDEPLDFPFTGDRTPLPQASQERRAIPTLPTQSSADLQAAPAFSDEEDSDDFNLQLRDPGAPAPAPSSSNPGISSDSGAFPNVQVVMGRPMQNKRSPGPERSGLDMDALVEDAVSSIAADMPQKDDSSDLPKESLIAGLDIRKHASRIAEMAEQRWASFGLMDQEYRGKHPFWLQDHEDNKIGPCAYEQAIEIVKAEARARLGEQAKISADQQHWIDLNQFALLTGQEMFLRDDEEADLPRGSMNGTLNKRSLTSVLGALARQRSTGRLFLVDQGYRRFNYREVDLVGGKPTYVYANLEELQLPTLLISKRIVPKTMLPELIHQSLKDQRPLHEIAGAQAGQHIGTYQSMFLKERLAEVFNWSAGRFIFDGTVQSGHTTPFVKTMFQLLPEMVYRTLPLEFLRLHMKRFSEARLTASQHFEQGLTEMMLADAQQDFVNRLAKGKRLSGMIKGRKDDEKQLLSLAYVLIESELLLAPL